MSEIKITEEFLKEIEWFTMIDSKDNLVKRVESLIEMLVKTDFISEYDMAREVGFLFDVKKLIQVIPFRE